MTDTFIEQDEVNLMLTTNDNPYNPHTQYDKWKEWDVDNGYNTESYLARMVFMDKDVDIDDELAMQEATNKAVQSIIDYDTLGVYTLV